MKKYIITAITLLGIIACNNSKNEFLITNNSVGGIEKNTPIQKLDSIFAKDSIVNSNLEGELRNELLEITPKIDEKNEKLVESIFVLSPLYVTEKGISLKSTFKDVKEKYPDIEIEPSISSIIVTPKGKNYYFTFDKTALKSTNFGLSDSVSENDIEESAVITRITLNF